MKLHKNSIIGFIFSLFLALTLFLVISNRTTYAKYKGHYETPTELRGNWYESGQNNYGDWQTYHMYIGKKAVYQDGMKLYDVHNHKMNNAYMLYVQKINKKDMDFAGNTYVLNGKLVPYKTESPYVWLSKKRIHGKRVLKSYTLMNGIETWTRSKIKKDYSDLRSNISKSKVGV
ncbi:hypothetical protein DY138_02710 [Apilactobacillus timberlakei]|uniref:hypothetical protein n=1 Tax=Apilactobacillus timberlakei TaxID=2008380 RepID=UPI00112B6F61|nr:hypothetical protein [Apilactobacillus timberlakei]TPR19573.1 hypothetical protein DY138_02710 [Apilactobacillus timberlakei]TPR20550.1 hypothetical protein DY061_04350 [Apilactobacillus timberlakei]TPR22594.1 hypothetical protein DY083_03620 [Apilactobacillus timberlakei]TPR23270.1 hypothetical protein DY102_04305 [Apilactobacillus timberlakei]